VGPTFYGNKVAMKVSSITETVTAYTAPTGLVQFDFSDKDFSIFPIPANDFIAVQANQFLRENCNIELVDISGRIIQKSWIAPGSTITYFDTQKLYSGTYVIKIGNNEKKFVKKILLNK
jgi:hypothetical protein